MNAIALSVAIAVGLIAWPAAASGQVVAKITGPTEVEAGDLVILDGSSSSNAKSFRWLLVNSKKTFLPIENGTKCVFASGAAGDFIFVLVVGGFDNNEKLTAADATFTVHVKGGQAPNPPPADPELPPGKRTVVIIYEAADGLPVPAEAAANELRAKGVEVRLVDDDTTTADGGTPAELAASFREAKKVGLPALAVQVGQVAKAWELPATKEAIVRKALEE